MKILVFGKDGQVGSELVKILTQVIPIGRQECDFEDQQQIINTLNKYKPDIVINCVAYTNVEKAETEPGKVYLINANAPRVIADWCDDNLARFVHISTDYVFNNIKELNPMNEYGRSKLIGEQYIQNTMSESQYAIVRTSHVYKFGANNLLSKIISNVVNGKSVSLVNDVYLQPTLASDLAYFVNEYFIQGTMYGIQNLCSPNKVSVHDFGKEVLRLLDVYKDIKSINSIELKSSVMRPKDPGLWVHLDFPDWKYSLFNCLKNIKLKKDILGKYKLEQ